MHESMAFAAYSHAADGDCRTGALCKGGRAFCRAGRCSDVVHRHIDLKGRRWREMPGYKNQAIPTRF